MRRAAELVILTVAILLAAYLRFRHLADVSFWLDELAVDMTTAAAHYPWWRWITGFDPEHGSLYHLTTLIGLTLFRSPELGARFIPALAGIASLPIGWLAARRIDGDSPASMVFPILLAVAPLHVYYSREARPYALLMLLAIALIAAAVVRAHVAVVTLLVVATLYTSASGAPLLASFVIATAAAALLARDRRLFAYAAVGACGTLLIPLLYRGERYDVVRAPFKPIDHAFVRGVLESLSVAALDTAVHHRAALLFAAFALLGAIALARRNRTNAAIVIAMGVLPAILAIAALRHLDHWYAPRYVSATLPGYLLLVAQGIAVVGQAIVPVLRRYGGTGRIACPTTAVVLACVLVWQAFPAARDEPLRKVNWRAVAQSVWSHAAFGDWVIATSPWASRCIGYYLRRLPPRVRVVGGPPQIAEQWNGVWIVSAGGDDPGWTCRYPTVLSDRLESLRVRYAPSAAHFLATRSTAAERHALALTAVRNDRFALTLGADDEPFLVDGWAPPNRNGDDDDRWIVGTHASFVAPFETPADRRVTIRAHAFAAIPQVMQVSINGTAVAAFRLTPDYRDYSSDIDASRWKADRPNVIALDFATATTASNVDQRKLAAAITEIDIQPRNAAAAASASASRAYVVRLDGFPMTPIASRVSVAPAKRAALIASLGADPAHAVNSAETLAQSLVDLGSCLDDSAFVHLARSAIVDARDRGGDRYFLDFVRQGGTRSKLIDVLLDELDRKSDVFRRSTPNPSTHF